MEAAERIGIRGTPTSVLQDGTVIPGYMPAGRLVEISNRAAESVVNWAAQYASELVNVQSHNP